MKKPKLLLLSSALLRSTEIGGFRIFKAGSFERLAPPIQLVLQAPSKWVRVIRTQIFVKPLEIHQVANPSHLSNTKKQQKDTSIIHSVSGEWGQSSLRGWTWGLLRFHCGNQWPADGRVLGNQCRPTWFVCLSETLSYDLLKFFHHQQHPKARRIRDFYPSYLQL